MKNLFFTIAAGFMILSSCSVDDSIETQQTATLETVYVLNQNDGSSTIEYLPSNANQDNLNNSLNSYSGALNGNTNGTFLPSDKNDMTISWKGTQNANATFGEAELKQESPNSTFNYKLVTECVIVEGNEAIYGGIITKANGINNDMPNVEEGWRVYFKVTDDGLGLGTNDKISNNIIFASPASVSLCNVYSPSDSIWSKKGYTDVISPGYVNVSN